MALSAEGIPQSQQRVCPGQSDFVLLPVRWVVERAFAWLARIRRLSKDYEHLLHHSAGFIYLASIVRLLNRLEPSH